MALSFNEIGKKKLEEIERPPLPPVGTYRWQITKLPVITKSNDEKWEFVAFPIRAVEALDDVDVDSYKGEISNIVQNHRFMFNLEDEAEFEKTAFRVRTFLEKHVKCWEEGMSMNEAVNNSVNQQFLGTITWKQDKEDADLFHANIGRTAPLD